MTPLAFPLIASRASVSGQLLSWLPVAVCFFLLLTMTLMWRSTRRQLESAKPAGLCPPAYRPGFLMRFFILCSGVHPDDLAPLGAGRHAAHAVAGMLLSVPAVMAFLGLRLWLVEFLPDQPAAQVAWAAFGAALVFLVDLGCVWMLNGVRGRGAVTSVIPRVALAVVLGYFITKPFVIVIFKDEIAAAQREKKKGEVLSVAGSMQEQRRNYAEQHQPFLVRYRESKGDVQRRIEALGSRRREVQGRHDELHKSLMIEVTKGQNGRPDGEGKYAGFIKKELAKVEADLGLVDREEASLKGELDRLALSEESAVNHVLNDPKYAETQSAFDTLMRDARQAEAKSIGRQLELVREYVGAGDGARKREYWFWHLLFWFLDTIPITVKLWMRRKDVQMLQDMQESRVEAAIAAEKARVLLFADHTARQQHESQMRRIKISALTDDVDLLLQGTSHTVLRGLQYEIELKRTFEDLLKKMPKTPGEEHVDWQETMAPLRSVQKQAVARLQSIVGSYGPQGTSVPDVEAPTGEKGTRGTGSFDLN